MTREDAEELVVKFMAATYESGYHAGREMANSDQSKAAIEERTRLRDRLIDILVGYSTLVSNLEKVNAAALMLFTENKGRLIFDRPGDDDPNWQRLHDALCPSWKEMLEKVEGAEPYETPYSIQDG